MKHITLIVLITIVVSACSSHQIVGDGHIITKELKQNAFSKVDVSGAFDVEIVQGNSQNVNIFCDENLYPYIIVKQEGNTLKIDTKDNSILSPSKKIKIVITSSQYSELEASGASSFTSMSKINAENLKVDMSGSSSLKLYVNAKILDVELSGSSDAMLDGVVTTFKIDGSGSTSVKAENLVAEDVDIDISGSGEAVVNTNGKLDVDISGAGKVLYKGNPTSIQKEISGAGIVSRVE